MRLAGADRITAREAAERSGVPVATLRRWARRGLVPLRDGAWTPAAAAQARIVARLRERGHSLASLEQAAREGRLAHGFAADLVSGPAELVPIELAADETGLEPALIERIMVLLGSPADRSRELSRDDLEALRHCAAVLEAGFPLVALLQLVRVYAQAMRRVAEAEVRLFHLYVHEPLIAAGSDELAIAEEMGDMAAGILPVASPVFEYMHRRYLRFFVDQDVVGHMEMGGAGAEELGRVSVSLCFVDLTGFTRFTEEEGDEQALDRIERFVEAVELTLPREATIVKTIGDEVMVVSPDPARLTGWAVGFMTMFSERPRPRVGIHHGRVVYRDGDYFGGDVNLAHRVVDRALGGEVLVTEPVAATLAGLDYLYIEPIGDVALKGFPEPTALFAVRSNR